MLYSQSSNHKKISLSVNSILLLILLVVLSTTLGADDWSQTAKIVSSDRAASDYFGYSIDIDGNWLISGARLEDEDASGNNNLSGAGSAYIYYNNSGTWSQFQKIVSDDREGNDTFGYSVAISGNYAIVGAQSEGSYVEEEEEEGGEEERGIGGGSTTTDTTISSGAAYIFYYNGSTWSQQAKLAASDRDNYDYFGTSVAIDGDYAIVGAYGEDENASGIDSLESSGSAYIFYRSGTTWTQQAKLVASDREKDDRFGSSLDIDGDYAIIGAYSEDENTSGADSLDDAGSAYIFHRSGTTWSQQAKIVSSDRAADDYFGNDLAISGDYAVVGANQEDEDADGNNTLTGAGSAYIFYRSGSVWSQQQKIVSGSRGTYGGDYFGYSVDIDNEYVVVGSYGDGHDENNSNYIGWTGSVYIFKRSGSTWSEDDKMLASDRAQNDHLGCSVAISTASGYAIAGAKDEDEDASGGNTMSNSGSAYIYYTSAADYSLPVTFSGFKLQSGVASVSLSWITESEIENLGFIIQRKNDGDWIKLADYISDERLRGQGSTTMTTEYSYKDAAVAAGETYTYRIGDVDYHGIVTWHGSKKITVDANEYQTVADRFKVAPAFPNPFNPELNLSIYLPETDGVSVIIYDLTGREVATVYNDILNGGTNQLTWNGSNQSSGLYFVRTVSGSHVDIQKVLLVK